MPDRMAFSPSAMAEVKRLMGRYPADRKKSALLPLLHLAQKELGPHLSTPLMDYVAGLLEIKPIEVYEVASFYTMFNTRPVGRFKLEPCRTGPCALNGAEELIAYLEQKLGIKDGETTPDGLFTLKSTECLGSCGSAPLMQIGEDYHENLSFADVDRILETLKKQAGR